MHLHLFSHGLCLSLFTPSPQQAQQQAQQGWSSGGYGGGYNMTPSQQPGAGATNANTNASMGTIGGQQLGQSGQTQTGGGAGAGAGMPSSSWQPTQQQQQQQQPAAAAQAPPNAPPGTYMAFSFCLMLVHRWFAYRARSFCFFFWAVTPKQSKRSCRSRVW